MFFSDAIKSPVVLKYFLTNSVIGMRFIHMSSYILSKILRVSFAFQSSFAPNLLQILSIIILKYLVDTVVGVFVGLSGIG